MSTQIAASWGGKRGGCQPVSPVDTKELTNMNIQVNFEQYNLNKAVLTTMGAAGLGSSTVDQVLKYTKYPKYIPSTSTGQVLIF